jgi:hypothetical protein
MPGQTRPMSARFLNPSARNDNAVLRPLDDAISPGHALGDRACCCSAKAMVQVVMPPTPARPHRTELLLCGHHYRVSRQALAMAGAKVRELPWISDSTAAWIRPGHHGFPAQVS